MKTRIESEYGHTSITLEIDGDRLLIETHGMSSTEKYVAFKASQVNELCDRLQEAAKLLVWQDRNKY